MGLANESTGGASALFGINNKSYGFANFSMGNGNAAYGNYNTSFGENNITSGNYTLAIGKIPSSTKPALKAALWGYHIILTPLPCAGGSAEIFAGLKTGEPKSTELSATCKVASGLLVPIPTLPVLLL